ncbi:unnamed protein product [Amoebophrya sp. A120]|nr:unnamed protein product [Amoebophrya sp. A120]|eukprot:GSA120T00010137001.1
MVFQVGDTVKIHGLANRVELNGRTGRVVEADDSPPVSNSGNAAASHSPAGAGVGRRVTVAVNASSSSSSSSVSGSGRGTTAAAQEQQLFQHVRIREENLKEVFVLNQKQTDPLSDPRGRGPSRYRSAFAGDSTTTGPRTAPSQDDGGASAGNFFPFEMNSSPTSIFSTLLDQFMPFKFLPGTTNDDAHTASRSDAEQQHQGTTRRNDRNGPPRAPPPNSNQTPHYNHRRFSSLARENARAELIKQTKRTGCLVLIGVCVLVYLWWNWDGIVLKHKQMREEQERSRSSREINLYGRRSSSGGKNKGGSKKSSANEIPVENLRAQKAAAKAEALSKMNRRKNRADTTRGEQDNSGAGASWDSDHVEVLEDDEENEEYVHVENNKYTASANHNEKIRSQNRRLGREQRASFSEDPVPERPGEQKGTERTNGTAPLFSTWFFFSDAGTGSGSAVSDLYFTKYESLIKKSLFVLLGLYLCYSAKLHQQVLQRLNFLQLLFFVQLLLQFFWGTNSLFRSLFQNSFGGFGNFFHWRSADSRVQFFFFR